VADWKEEDKAPFQTRWAKPDAATRTGCSIIASKKKLAGRLASSEERASTTATLPIVQARRLAGLQAPTALTQQSFLSSMLTVFPVHQPVPERSDAVWPLRPCLEFLTRLPHNARI